MIAILLLTVYLTSTTELGQLLKLPMLVEHFIEHRQKNPDSTVLRFLAIHYSGNHLQNHPRNEDYKEDQKLPFIIHNDLLTVSFILSKPIFLEAGALKTYCSSRTKISACDDGFAPAIYLSGIWQPPKHC